MDDRTKCEIYTKLLNSFNKNGELKEEINVNSYNNQIKLIQTEVLSKVVSDQETALQMLKILIKNNVQDIQQDVLTILRNDNVDQELKVSILDSIRSYMADLLHSRNVADLASLYGYWKEFDVQKFFELFASACIQEKLGDSQSEPINFGILIIDHFLPLMLSTTQAKLQLLTEVATKIAKMYPISNLSTKEYQEVLKKVPGLLTNLVNLQESKSDVWQKPLHFLTEYLDEKIYSPEIRGMFSKSSLNSNLVQIEFDNNINIELLKYISENNLVLVTRLFRGWKNLDLQKFRTALREMCQSPEYVKYCKTFLFDKLIPVIMAPNDVCDPVKLYYIEIALEFASYLPITKLTSEEYNKFIGSVNEYIKNISDRRDANFEHWHKLWIFLVRLFGRKLHHSMSLINRLLRIVEHAFRNSSYEQRLRSYDCWKELIDNVSLDSHHMSSEKQIRLLLTPLRAKFSKQEAVIVKRFEVFVYLIEKLQDKAVLVLKEFLEFCFGEVGEDTDPNKCGQGRSLPELWHKSAKVLLAMLGHSHDDHECCLETDTEISLKGPVLNSNNISIHYCHTINSVAESCMLLKEVELNQDKNIVFTCFWTSLLGIILGDNVPKKDKCVEAIGRVMEKLLKDNDPYNDSIAAKILKSVIKFDWAVVSSLVLNNLEYFIRIIFSVPLDKDSPLEVEKFQIMLCTVESPDVTLKIIRDLFHCFAEYKTVESNVNFVAQFWVFLVNELDDYAKNKCLNFLVWPALHLHHITDHAKEVLIYEHYKQIVTKFVEKSHELQVGLFKNFEKILKHNPLLSKNVLTLITMFAPKTENKELTNITLTILDLMMVIPTAEDSNNQRQTLELYLKKFYESGVSDNQDHETIKKLCTCLQHVLKFKHYDIINSIEPHLKSLPDNVKWVHGKFLSMDFLMDLFDKETDVSCAEKIRRLIDVFRNVKNPEPKKDLTPFMPPGGRSAKIAKLVKQIPSSPGKRSGSPTTIKLFGKDIDTLSPLNVKGSQLKDKNDTPFKTETCTPTHKSTRTMCIDDESNSKFVLIESEVKLDKNKLTEHQKESFKKRREDIPALYQDLSQSMSQSLESNSAAGKMENIADIFKKSEVDCNIKSPNAECNVNIVSDHVKTVTISGSLTTAIEPVLEMNEHNSAHVDETTEIDKSIADSLADESQKDLSKVELKKIAVESELKKLPMSIVGAEEFFTTNLKKKRREKKTDLEENAEKSSKGRKSKGPSCTMPYTDKNILTTTNIVAFDDYKNPTVENNDLQNDTAPLEKRREGYLNRKSISNKQPDESVAVSITKDESDSSGIINIEEKSTDLADVPNKEQEVKKKYILEVTVKENSFETTSNEDKYKEAVTSGDHMKLLLEECSEVNGDKNYNKLESRIAGDVVDTKEEEVVKKKNRKRISAKSDPPEAVSKIELNSHANIREESSNLLLEDLFPEGKTNTSGLMVTAEISKTPAITEIESQSVVNTPNVVKKRGRPIGSKGSKSQSSKMNQTTHSRRRIPVESPYDTEVASNILSTIKASKGPLIKDCASNDSGKQKRRSLRVEGNNLPNDEYHHKPVKKVVQIEAGVIDIYRFDTEQERVSEAEIVPLRSPNKDKKLTVALHDTPNAFEMVSVQEVQKVKKNLLSDISGEKTASPVARKSKRKSVPTKKFTQSELFKSSEQITQTPGSLKRKKTPSAKVSRTSNKHGKASSTQSELFKQTGEEAQSIGHVITFKSDLKPADSDKVSRTIDNDYVPCSYVNKRTDVRKGLKRRRSSSEDDDDIIESSQDSATSNVSVAKLKLSLTKRSSFDKSLPAEVKYSIKEHPKTDVNIDSGSDKDNINVTPEEKKRKRGRPRKIQKIQICVSGKGRPRKYPVKNDIFAAQGPISEDCQMITDSEKSDTSAEIASDNDNQQADVTTQGDVFEHTLSNSGLIKIDTSSAQRKLKRGRPRKSLAVNVELLENSTERQTTDSEGLEESQSLVTINGKSSPISEVVDMDKPKSKREENAEEIGLEEKNDVSTSEDSSVHILESIDNVTSKTIASVDKHKLSKPTSPEKTEKGTEDCIQDIMQDVKKQVMEMGPSSLDMSVQDPQRTQSQDTQTQNTESMNTCEEIQLQLDLPQKPVLTEADRELAEMDTASWSLGNDFHGLNISGNGETELGSNKTVIERKILRKDVQETESANPNENAEEDCKDIIVDGNKAAVDEDVILMENKMLKKDLLESESESIIESSEATKPFTESNQNTDIMETENISSAASVNLNIHEIIGVEHITPVKEEVASSPGPLQSSLPSSPVTGDTPNRTSELLNSTSDISPIGSKSCSDKSSSDDEFVERKLMPVALKFDDDADHEENKEKSPEKADDAPEKINKVSSDKVENDVDKSIINSSPPKDGSRISVDVKSIAERSNRFFDMVKSGSPSSLRLFNKRKSNLNVSSSPSRIKKLMSNIKAPSQCEISDNVTQEDILTFAREVPSPLALPRSSILKRKHSDTGGDDGLSPCPKRKRVNFSDPCTTSKKVFINEDDGTSQCLFGATPEDDLDKQLLEVLAENSPPTESDTIETEQSLQANNPLLLRDDMPIYPDLVDCEKSVCIISRKLTSPMFVNALLNKLNSKNIKTIGDLAKQSEVSIARLPFKTPMVANVYTALDNYYHKNFKSKVSKEKYEARINGELKSTGEATASLSRLKVTLVKMDVKDELSKVLERAKSQGMSTDSLCSLLFSAADHKDVLAYVKTHLNFETKDIVEEKEYPKIVRHITETVGFPKIFEILAQPLESSGFLLRMIEGLIDKKPLNKLMENRSLQELQAAIWENVDKGIYTKKDLLDTCFLPFVHFMDLTSAFNKLTLIEIEKVVVTRLKIEDYPVFVRRILKNCSASPQVKEEILSHCTVTDLTNNIIKKASPADIIRPFTHIVVSTDKSRADLLEIYTLVTNCLVENFPPSKLMELSIEFQKKIPIRD